MQQPVKYSCKDKEVKTSKDGHFITSAFKFYSRHLFIYYEFVKERKVSEMEMSKNARESL